MCWGDGTWRRRNTRSTNVQERPGRRCMAGHTGPETVTVSQVSLLEPKAPECRPVASIVCIVSQSMDCFLARQQQQQYHHCCQSQVWSKLLISPVFLRRIYVMLQKKFNTGCTYSAGEDLKKYSATSVFSHPFGLNGINETENDCKNALEGYCIHLIFLSIDFEITGISKIVSFLGSCSFNYE